MAPLREPGPPDSQSDHDAARGERRNRGVGVSSTPVDCPNRGVLEPIDTDRDRVGHGLGALDVRGDRQAVPVGLLDHCAQLVRPELLLPTCPHWSRRQLSRHRGGICAGAARKGDPS